MSKKENKQKYKFKKSNSILEGINDEYVLTENEYYKLYSFFVTYSLCKNQSQKSRTFVDYGWSDNALKKASREGCFLEKVLAGIIDFSNSNFVFTEEDDLKKQFERLNLQDAALSDFDTERFVISKTNANNKYLKLFYRIRDCFAHGKFVLKKSSESEKMLVMQDNDKDNVTARIVIKLSTVMNFVDEIDRAGLLTRNKNEKQAQINGKEKAA